MRVVILAGLIVAGMIPLALAFRANRATSLAHALVWGGVAWLSWGGALILGNAAGPGMDAGRYVALCLTGCAGIAVLGARRPLFGAWNFVVLGLFTVMMLPLAESLLLGTDSHDGLRLFFLAATVAIGAINYLPTRFAPAALLLLAAGTVEIALLFFPGWFEIRDETLALHALILAVPWISWLCVVKRSREGSEFDQIWLGFRDRWGLLWSQRVREQFNHAAANAGWPVKLSWRGLVIEPGMDLPAPGEQERMLHTLRALLQRFGTGAEF
jgi:hypothetical protein